MRVCLNPNVAKSSLAVRPSFLRKWKMKRRNCPLRHSARIFDMHPASRQKGRNAASRNRPVVLGLEVFLFEGERTPLSRGLSKLLQHRSSLGVIYAPNSRVRYVLPHLTLSFNGAQAPYIEDSREGRNPCGSVMTGRPPARA